MVTDVDDDDDFIVVVVGLLLLFIVLLLHWHSQSNQLKFILTTAMVKYSKYSQKPSYSNVNMVTVINHMITHTGVKPFECNVCRKRFSVTIGQLQQTQRTLNTICWQTIWAYITRLYSDRDLICNTASTSSRKHWWETIWAYNVRKEIDASSSKLNWTHFNIRIDIQDPCVGLNMLLRQFNSMVHP